MILEGKYLYGVRSIQTLPTSRDLMRTASSTIVLRFPIRRSALGEFWGEGSFLSSASVCSGSGGYCENNGAGTDDLSDLQVVHLGVRLLKFLN